MTVRLQPLQVAALDTWIRESDNPMVTRPEAIRIILKERLA